MNVSQPHSFPIGIDPADIDFMGHVNNASYLRWVLPEAVQKELGGFLQELGDLGPNVIRFKGAPALLPSAHPSALHRVYLGEDKDAGVDLTGLTLRLTNLQARDGPRDPRHDWIWIRVARS